MPTDPGQAVQELGPVDLSDFSFPDGKALGSLARATVVVIAGVCILEPLRVPVVPGQREVGFARGEADHCQKGGSREVCPGQESSVIKLILPKKSEFLISMREVRTWARADISRDL